MRRSRNGQTLIEVVVATAVGIFVVTALTFATIFSLRNANFAKNSAQATKRAQEGIERVRIGRDRNQCINGGLGINSWNGGNNSCSVGGSIWGYQITGSSSNCENTTVPGSKCYFNIDSGGVLTYISSSTTFPTSFAERIPTAIAIFYRVIILSDDSSGVPPPYTFEKKATAVVQWKDATGTHESRLTTVLRKL